jgi:hypothetical protein
MKKDKNMVALIQKRVIDGRQLGANTHTFLNVSIADFERCLTGLDYPARKSDLIQTAKSHQASTSILRFLDLLPEGNYYHFGDIAFMAWTYLLI